MPSVEITTLGQLRIAVDGEPVDWLASQRLRTACLVFLAVEGEVSRDRLLGVFWPETDGDRARRSLNQVIYTIRRAVGDAAVLTRGERIQIGDDVAVDVVRFTRAVESGDVAAAVSMYAGSFLADASLSTTAEFEQWVDARRVALQRMHRRARRGVIEQHIARGDGAAALQAARDWVALDPDDDEAQHRCIALLIEAGRPAEAIGYYEQYRARLRSSELEPLDETTALITALRGAAAPLSERAVVAATLSLDAAPRAREPSLRGIGRIINELKRRRVLGVLAVYFVIAWAAIEISDTVFPRLGLPEWAPTLVVALTLIGAPFAFFFAWFYDLTPDGVRRTAPLTSASATGALPRLLPRWGSMLLLAGVLLYGGWTAYHRLKSVDSLGNVAVFPFCVAGEGMENEADDIAVLLAHQLDAVPALATADPNVLIPLAQTAHLDCRDSRNAALLAQKVGARSFLLGSVVRSGGEIRAEAALYDADGSRQWAVASSDTAAGWVRIVDGLIRKIVAQHGSSAGDRVLSVAATTTHSDEALRAFLDGERALRKLEWKNATDAYKRAVAIDSTFALAWFRMAVSLHRWAAPAEQVRAALYRTAGLRSRLPEREQRLYYAFEAFARGALKDAGERLRSYLGVYPDDAEAWQTLSELEMQWGGLLGHDLTAAIAAGESAAALGLRDALFLLSWAYWLNGDHARSDSIATQVLAEMGSGDWVLGLDAVRAFRSRDERRIQPMLRRVDGLSDEHRIAAIQWAALAPNYAVMERISDRLVQQQRSEGAHGVTALARTYVYYNRGKRRAGAEQLANLRASYPAAADEYRAFMTLDPAVAIDEQQLRELRRALEPRDTGSAGPPPTGANASELLHGFHLPVRLYLLGRISVVLGDDEEAEAYARAVEQLPANEDAPAANANFAAAIRAHAAAQRGQTADALAWLDRIRVEVAFPLNGNVFLSHYPERVLRADLLAATGQSMEALRWYKRLTVNPWFDHYQPHVLAQAAQLHEQSGDQRSALAAYQRLYDLLSDCDPELRPLRDRAEQRVRRSASR